MADDHSEPGRPPRASMKEGPLAELFRRTTDEPRDAAAPQAAPSTDSERAPRAAAAPAGDPASFVSQRRPEVRAAINERDNP